MTLILAGKGPIPDSEIAQLLAIPNNLHKKGVPAQKALAYFGRESYAAAVRAIAMSPERNTDEEKDEDSDKVDPRHRDGADNDGNNMYEIDQSGPGLVEAMVAIQDIADENSEADQEVESDEEDLINENSVHEEEEEEDDDDDDDQENEDDELGSVSEEEQQGDEGEDAESDTSNSSSSSAEGVNLDEDENGIEELDEGDFGFNDGSDQYLDDSDTNLQPGRGSDRLQWRTID